MKKLNYFKTTIQRLLTVSALFCFAFSPAPNAFGLLPPPDGGYPGFNTAEGQNAPFSLTSGSFNTATGAGSLLFNTETLIRPLAPRRFYSTPAAPTARL